MIITKNSTQDILLVVSLLERYDSDETLTQQLLFDTYFNKPDYEGSGKRKKIGSIFQEFDLLYEKEKKRFLFELKQARKNKYYLSFGNNDGNYINDGIEVFDENVIYNLTGESALLAGVSRDTKPKYFNGLWDFLDNAIFPYRAYLFSVLVISIKNNYLIEAKIDDLSRLIKDRFDIQFKKDFVFLKPKALFLSEKFILIAEICFMDEENDDTIEIEILLKDIEEAFLILPDLRRI